LNDQSSDNGSRYDLLGAEDAEVVVLIHGLGLNRQVWRDLVPSLSRRYRVLNYDLYGHGDSPPPPEKPSLALFSQQLVELLDELGIERCALVGFSLGGMINRRLAMDHPERVSALVILNSPHERGPEAQKLVEQRALDSATGGPGATLDATIERWFTPAFREANGEYIDEVRGWVLANDPEIYAQCRQVLAFGVIELIRPRPPIVLPALVMTCERDSGSTPAMSRAIAAEIDGAKVVIVPQLQHMGLVETPAFFVGAITAFLDALR
jgi:pimeloyl-ACP methyl ester carboxylesterase